MLVNPIYGAGGESPTPPSSGYVEDKLVYYDEGNAEKLLINPFADNGITITTPQVDVLQLDPTDGFTIEAYVQLDGDSVNAYSRAFCVEASVGTDINVAFGNGGGSTNSDYRYNPMIRWGASIDYEYYMDGLYYGDKHTFVIVSTPDSEGTADNTITFYIDGVLSGQSFTQNRNVSKYQFIHLGIENGYSYERPINGKLYNGRFYTRALTANEIAANHTNDVAKYGGNT